MHSLSYKTLLIILVFLLIPIVFLLRSNFKTKTVLADWWNEGWNYRVAVNIGNTSGGNLTNYQVNINIGTSTLIAAGKMKTDCSDIRITDQTGKILPYWFSGCNTASTQIWPKVPSIPTSGATVYLYYGNPSATSSKTIVGTSDYPGLSCKSILDAGDSTGNNTYWIDPTNGDTSDKFQAYCDMANDSGGWMLVTQSMINNEIGSSVTLTKTTGVNGGLVYTSMLSDIIGCTNHYQKLYFNDVIPWTQIKSDYQFLGGNSCWSIFGDATINSGTNLIPFAAGTDTIRNQVKMGGSNGDNFDGVTNRCDNVTYNFWHSNQGIGTTRSAQVILRRNSMASLAGLGTGANCTGAYQPWQYSNIYVRETAMSFPGTSTPSTEETGGGPIAYWKFDEGVGTTTYDATSSHTNAFFAGTTSPTWLDESQCISGKCLKLNGPSSSLQSIYPYNFEPNNGPFSISLWFNANSFAIPDAPELFKFNIGGSGWINLRVAYSNELEFYVKGVGGTIMEINSPNNYLSENKWYFATVVYDPTNGSKIYIDGQQMANTSNINVGALTKNGAILIGKGFNSYSWNGKIDEFKIYPYARTATQIKNDYASGLAGQSSAKGANVNMGSASSGKSLSDGLVGYWKFDEGIGTTTADSSGNNITSTLSGSTLPSWSSGKYGVGISFNGINSYLNLGSFADPSPSHSFSFWVNSATAANTSKYLFDTSTGRMVIAWNGTTSGKLAFYDNSGSWKDSTIDAPNDGLWHHIVFVLDAGTSKGSIYTDGILRQSGISYTPTAISTNSAIGSRYNGTPSFFTGSLDEIRIYNRALSSTEVSALYNFAPGPVAYWKFDDASGTSAIDSSGNNLTGTLGTGSSSPTWSTGKINKALSFDGSSDYVYVTDTPPLNPTTAFTISTWIKPTAIANNTNYNIIAKENYGLKLGYRLFLSGYGGCVNMNCLTGSVSDGTNRISTPSTVFLTDINTWHYVSFTYDSSSLKIYVDGTLKSSVISTVPLIVNTPLNAAIGRHSSGGEHFPGFIDEFKFYNYARTSEQIIQDMSGSTKIAGPIAYYKFDEGFGTQASNWGLGGSDFNASLVGNTKPTWVSGKKNQALSLNGIDNYVNMGSLNNLSGNNETVTFWAKTNAFSDFAPFIDSSLGGGANTIRLYIGYYYSAGPYFMVFIGDGSANDTLNFNYSIPLGTWKYYALTIDGTVVKLYLDGVLYGTMATTKTLAAGNYMVGRGFGGAGFLNGLVDEVKIYNYALSSDEIKTDYNAGSSFVFGSSSQTIGATTTSLDYCVPGSTDPCSAPVGEYKFDEKTGTTIYNTSGSGTTGTWNGSSNHWTTGKINSAGYFNQNNDYVDLGNPSVLDFGTGAFTTQAWVYNTMIGNTNSFQGIISKGGFNTGYELRFVYGGDSIRYIDGFIGANSFGGAFNFQTSTWYHIALTRDNSNNVSLYVNGQRLYVVSNSNSLGSSNWEIGRIRGANGLGWQGKIDQVRIYNYARAPSQIAYDYNGGKPVGWWKMDECQGTTLNDWSGNSNHGTLSIGASGTQNSIGTCQVGTSAAWTNGASGKVNSSLNFDGTDDLVMINDPVLNSTAMTVCAWTKKTAYKQYQGVISDYVASAGQRNWILGYETPQNTITYFVGDGTNTDSISSTGFTQDVWHHVCGIFDGNTGSLKISIDNIVKSKNTAITKIGPNQTSNSHIGRYAGSYNFGGQIDDVRIYNYALTPEQLKQVYNGGSVNFN